ncbi:uncharacterized protein LOC143285679 [Babylonia areolata]|uniref:uncharacterized protein LOC143285679 n=1 Tax=Babylonia areolata TaxID=304850 RepID=UPI003FD14276
MTTGGRGGSGVWGTFRRHFWGVLVVLALCCSALYVLLYYHISLSPSTSFFSRSFLRRQAVPSIPPTLSSSSSSRTQPSNSSSSSLLNTTTSHSRNLPEGSTVKDGPGPPNASAVPLLTLFSTWGGRKDLNTVRRITLRNWAQLKPLVTPVLFSNETEMTSQAQKFGWETLPVSRTAIGVPVLKNMYLDAMSNFNSTLYAFANGDILFTKGLLDSLRAILDDPALPLDKHPLLVIGRRTNVAMVTEAESATFDNITRIAKDRGKLFMAMAEDFFITDRKFPWDGIPGVVVGRVAYDNWVVLHAIQKKHVVVDVTKTAPAVHQTTKRGNHEGFTHANSSYNDHILKRLYKRIRYMGGCVDCAPWRTLFTSEGKVRVEKKASRPKYC